MYLANNPASHRGVMNDAPRPDKIKGRIGKFDNLRVHPARIRLQTLKRHPARRRVNRSLRDVDSCYIGARSREPLSVQARSTANFEDFADLEPIRKELYVQTDAQYAQTIDEQ